MPPLYIQKVTSTNQQQIEQLLQTIIFKDYTHYRAINTHQALNYLRGTLLDTLKTAQAWFCYADKQNAQPLGMVLISPLPWESRFFDLKMAQMTLLSTKDSPTKSKQIISALLDKVINKSKEAGIQHLSIRIDSDYIETLHCLENSGFRIMDTLCTYICEDLQQLPPFKQKHYKIRSYQKKDYKAVLDVATTAFKDYPNRFTLDSHIPREKAALFFISWTKKFCHGEQGEQIFVAERKGRVVGFLGWQQNKELLALTDTQILGRGLGACYPIRFNAYYELLHHATSSYIATVDATEYDTQVSNLATINTYQRLGFRFVRAKNTLHCWLDTVKPNKENR